MKSTVSDVAECLINTCGWSVSTAGAAADVRTDSGVFSFGHDGTVVLFERYHESGYPLANLDIGQYSAELPPCDAAKTIDALARGA